MNVHAKTRHPRRARLLMALSAFAALIACAAAAPALAAHGDYSVTNFDVFYLNQDGSPALQAGSHPFEVTATIGLGSTGTIPDGSIKDVVLSQAAGLTGDTTAYPRCSTADFLIVNTEHPFSTCPDATAVGVTTNRVQSGGLIVPSAIYNLAPAPGSVARLGFTVFQVVSVIVDVRVKPSPDYAAVADTSNVSQVVPFFSGWVTLWGTPADPAHDAFRGNCLKVTSMSEPPVYESKGDCPVNIKALPFLTAPRACEGPLETTYATDSWENPGSYLPDGEPDLSDPNWLTGGVLTHDNAIPPQPQGFTGCSKLEFAPSIESKVTTVQAETGSGFDFNVDISDEGLKNPDGLAGSDAKKAVVTLPEGMTINPSVGEGLGVCTPADLDRETLNSAPGTGCPNSSKLGSLHVDTPLASEAIEGSVFLAEQDDPATTTPGAENPFDSLIALYLVLRNTNLGALVKLPLRIDPDPQTGQLVATLEDVPQIPFSHFNFHFREGARAPLVTPPTCGTHTTTAVLTPWANPDKPVITTSSFEITKGVGGGPCPPGGVPPFKPYFEAGSVNNNAGSFSPFNMRLIREDGEQDMTKFSAILPPGELGSLAGVSKCPDSAIAIAKSKQGREELASPTCPANSLIGHTLAGAGVGGALTYVKGFTYLGGPYNGSPLSVIAVTPAVAGPFDAGTVVVRLALDLNPKTAEVEVNGANSDPIPHILKGIVLKLRDLRVYVDRPNFTLNPTSCDESSARSVLFGSYLDVISPSDDKPVDLSTRFQAANCLNLGFKPKLDLNLKGGTKRGGHPGLTATYKPKAGDSNIEGLVVRLPRSAFLDQAHIKTICTRVQFAAKTCPKASQYGYIRAWTPLLEEPLQGPVYLRSSNHKLPDLVFDLHGLVDIEVSVRIDSAKGGIRATLEDSPDAPLSKVVLQMQGAKKGLIINSRNLCGHVSKANVQFAGHNGKQFNANPVMKAECRGKRKAKRQRR